MLKFKEPESKNSLNVKDSSFNKNDAHSLNESNSVGNRDYSPIVGFKPRQMFSANIENA